VQPTPPSLGYDPNVRAPGDFVADAEALRKAMKGFGTNEKLLIQILSNKDPVQIAAIRQTFNYRFSRSLEKDIASETSGYFEKGLLAIVRGPLGQDVYNLNDGIRGIGTKESVLNDVLLGRSNADMAAIKQAYQQTYRRSLENDVRGDLSAKTERHFMMVLAGNRAEDNAPVIPQQVDADVMDLYRATEGKVGTDQLVVCSILTQRSDRQIGAIAYAYEQKFRKTLESVIKRVRSILDHINLEPLTNNRTGILRSHARCAFISAAHWHG
jgi:annexin A7/11